MSVALNVFLTASARTLRMESLKLFCVCGLVSSAITTLVYSGTCGRREATIMFTSIGLAPAGLPDALALGRRHLRLDVVEQGVERPFNHGPETLALSLEIEFVDLRVEHRADDAAPLVGAEDSVARVGDLGQIGADEAARGQAINGLPTEPDGGQEQDHARGQAEIERTRMFAR